MMTQDVPDLDWVSVGVGLDGTKEYRGVGILCLWGRHSECTPTIAMSEGVVRVCTCPCDAHLTHN